MIPILFDKGATVFVGNGIGRLVDASSCVVNEKRNDFYELEMEYPMNGRYFRNIQLTSIIYAQPAPKKNPQPFRVYKISAPINGRVTINAEHISYQLSYIPLKAFSASSAANALGKILNNVVGDCPFTFETDIDKSGSYTMETPASVKESLVGKEGSILDIYHGEYEYDTYRVILHESRGADKSTSVIIAYGKNLSNLTQENKLEDVHTAIMPYYLDVNNTPVYLTSASGCETAPVVYSQYDVNYPFSLIQVMEMTKYIDKTKAGNVIQKDMYKATKDYIEKNNIGLPKISLDVEFVDLKAAIGEDKIDTMPDIYLCDTVSIRYEDLGVTAIAKINEVSYDVINERYLSISVGDEKVTLADEILGRPGSETAGGTLAISAIPENEIISIMRGEES